ncbi:PAS domain S-box-containing protein [Dethiosulfatibacter aminovorans DSM 17477]|uniref:PAS domain S-box-containing protein n=1 Tax=Dethiosulfatibacter aminovorans DSM 17477 TaxID=1121476 RepID=A0A1M6BQL5_9FIRM|nr:sigma 54-interacting transcriptional regulator [Dethiosulfatibacter aminovorans]SHI51007.1 PAS domain S-box-containing protein [Dethiosulfatibacter aminovorans DSM 17477]
MLKLSTIGNYVKQTATILSSVLDMDVLICDNELLIIADSSEINNCENSCLNPDSILTKVMESGQSVILESRDEYYGCQKCSSREICDVESIVGVPIVFEGTTIGSIGVYADTPDRKRNLLDKQDYFIKFINRMCDLMIGKLVDESRNREINILRKRLMAIMDTMADAVAAVDKDGRFIYSNYRFKELVGSDYHEDSTIYEYIANKEVEKSIVKSNDIKNKEVYLKSSGEEIFCLLSTKPIEFEDEIIGTVFTVKSMVDVYREVNDLSIVDLPTSFDDILGNSESMVSLKENAKQIADSSSTVLIQGESGTGKELLARAIHNFGEYRNKPFIAVNCAAIPDNLLESELFGYEEGAFSGARKGGKLGKFQLAHEGTIFLDEIGEMPLHLQPKILRVLQEKEIEKLGGTGTIPINVRVIAATNKNLEELIKEGKYREDLFYRLNVIPFKMIPLRERKEDIPLLLEYFLHKYNDTLGKSIKGYTMEAEKTLTNYKWKGNVRELQNVVEYMVNMSSEEYLIYENIPLNVREHMESGKREEVEIPKLDDVLKELIQKAIGVYGDTVEGKTLAAKALGISRATLYRKLKE